MIKITPKTIVSQIDELKPYSKYLMYACNMREKPAIDLNFEEMNEDQVTWNVKSMMHGVRRLMALVETQNLLFDVYSKEEKDVDHTKEDVKVLYMPANNQTSEKPFIVSIAGGAYSGVCSLVESYPTATRFNELGYNVFVLTYRVLQEHLMPKPIEDLAAAIRFILCNKEMFGVHSDEYIVNGYSAGANMTTLWGTEGKGYIHYNLPKPKALFPIYPFITSEFLEDEGKKWILSLMFGKDFDMETVEGYDIPKLMTEKYPPAYIVHAKDDSVVKYENSVKLDSLLCQLGIPVKLELAKNGEHGFGDGRGTDAEGWMDRAIAFVESL